MAPLQAGHLRDLCLHTTPKGDHTGIQHRLVVTAGHHTARALPEVRNNRQARTDRQAHIRRGTHQVLLARLIQDLPFHRIRATSGVVHHNQLTRKVLQVLGQRRVRPAACHQLMTHIPRICHLGHNHIRVIHLHRGLASRPHQTRMTKIRI